MTDSGDDARQGEKNDDGPRIGFEQFPSLAQYRSQIHDRQIACERMEPLVAGCAETVHQTFVSLFQAYSLLSSLDIYNIFRHRLAMHSHWDWLLSLQLASAGLRSAGEQHTRRAIEYLSVAVKIGRDNDRAALWQRQSRPDVNEADEKRFKSLFSIPGSFGSRKYEYVWPLLGVYDVVCDWASHANAATMTRKKVDFTQGLPRVEFFDEGKHVVSGIIIQLIRGVWLIEAWDECLKDLRVRSDEWKTLLAFSKEQLARTRFHYLESINSSSYRHVINDSKESMATRFQKSLKKQQAKSKSGAKSEPALNSGDET